MHQMQIPLVPSVSMTGNGDICARILSFQQQQHFILRYVIWAGVPLDALNNNDGHLNRPSLTAQVSQNYASDGPMG